MSPRIWLLFSVVRGAKTVVLDTLCFSVGVCHRRSTSVIDDVLNNMECPVLPIGVEFRIKMGNSNCCEAFGSVRKL